MNEDCPEDNREVYVFQVKDIPGVINTKERFYGFYIALGMDPRWYEDDDQVEWYRARIFSENQVLISYPAASYTLLHDRDAVGNETQELVQDGMDNWRHDFVKHKATRKWKHLLLTFSSSCVLVSKDIYKEAGEDEELSLEMIEVQCTHKNWAGGVNKEFFAGFTVGRTDMASYKKGRVDEPNQKMSKGAALLAKKRGGKVKGMDTS